MSTSGGHYGYVGDVPAGVESAAGDLGHLGGSLGTLAGEVGRDMASIQASWPGGETGRVAAADAARMGGSLEECHQVFARAERALSELYPVLVVGRRRVDELNDAYRVLVAQAQPIEDWLHATSGGGGDLVRLRDDQDALRAAQARSGFESLADIDIAYARVKAQVLEEVGICNTVLGRLTGEGAAPAGRGHAAGESRYDLGFGLLTAQGDRQVADILARRVAFPTDPAGVRDAWLLLSPDQRAMLLRTVEHGGDSLRFGNLNGIPAADRDVANQATLADQLDRLAAGLRAAGMASTTDPRDLERVDLDQFSIAEARSGLTLREARQALLLNRQLLRNGKSGAQLLAYEPGAYGGKGRAAIAFGDLDRADNIAFCVPGFRSGLDNVKNVASDALHLFKQAKQADVSRHTAVVAWQGYDTPDKADVLFQGGAERGAKLLAADVNAVRTTHDGAVRTLTVVGHSYGSTTTGLALQREHLNVDQVALIGSPGVGGDAKTAADLHLDPSRVFVGSASMDVVTQGDLGADPTETGFGTRFKAESVDKGWMINTADHSRYYDAGNQSESLYNLASIVTGHGDRLGPDGMLAEPRYTEIVSGMRGMPQEVEMDPESSRTATPGHDHANDLRSTSP